MSGQTPTVSFKDRIKQIYVNHFPTDKQSCDVSFPVIGLILSFLCMFVISIEECYVYNSVWFKFAFLLTSSAVALHLFWGFHIGDRKQFTPWILFKIVEIVCTIVALGFSFDDSSSHFVGVQVLGVICVVLSMVMTMKIILLSKEMQQKFLVT